MYTQLFYQLFWGYPLRGRLAPAEKLAAGYRPYFDRMLRLLACGDTAGFAAGLHDALQEELRLALDLLAGLGLPEAARLALPPHPERTVTP